MRDELLQGEALRVLWQRPITAEQLQAEMDRICRDTKAPDTLRAYFAALDNDPFLVAEIIARRKAGEFLVTVNNTHQWCRDNGIEPSLHIRCDAREFNKRFVAEPFPRCRYLIASQCHPSVAASLPKDQVLLWHAGDHLQATIQAWDEERGRRREWYPIFGGGTVMLRAMPLLLMLGFRKYELFGFDSCLRDSDRAHHAYPQPENDRRMEMTMRVGGRTLVASPATTSISRRWRAAWR